MFKNVGSVILDGEYITKDRNGKDIKLFMIFDMYYRVMENLRLNHTYPWLPKKTDLPSRSTILHHLNRKLR